MLGALGPYINCEPNYCHEQSNNHILPHYYHISQLIIYRFATDFNKDIH
jgi:hypothetical protein